ASGTESLKNLLALCIIAPQRYCSATPTRPTFGVWVQCPGLNRNDHRPSFPVSSFANPLSSLGVRGHPAPST
ncbi:hypothetical protein NW831_00515, partial [Synechococcus sp. R6-6]